MIKESFIKSKGFSMVELIVVITVLLLIITTATDLFISMISHQRRVLFSQELLNQTSYAVEYMSRALRMAREEGESDTCLETTGSNYEITHDGKGIKFINHSNNDICQEFYWNSTEGRLEESKNGGVSYIPITSGSLVVNSFNIKLYGDSPDDTEQPRVVLTMDIQFRGSSDQPRKIIQTTISQRNLDE